MHRHDLRVYYEDTDLAGIVYYANYLKYLERGRTEALRAAGVDQSRLKAETGIVFAVTRLEIDYRRPAGLDDLLSVETAAERIGPARAVLAQRVRRGAETLAEARVTVAALGPDGRPRRLPAEAAAALAALDGGE